MIDNKTKSLLLDFDLQNIKHADLQNIKHAI